MGTIHDRQLPFKGCLDLSAVQLVVPMVLINAIVYLAVHSGADHHYSTRIRDRNRTSQTRYTLPDSAAGGGVGTLFEEDHDSTEWHSIWEENNAAINEACRPIEDLLMAGETSGNAPLEGIPIGYTKKPGKVRSFSHIIFHATARSHTVLYFSAAGASSVQVVHLTRRRCRWRLG